jgi:hypothetical protein
MTIRIFTGSILLGLLLMALTVNALGAESVRLFEVNDSRSKVTEAAYAYYPAKAELRVRLTLANHQVKSGRYRDTEVVKHLLAVLPDDDRELFCTYNGNAILSVYTEHKR